MVDLAGCEPYLFLTGDLGFMALEPLRDALGKRFINAGVSEQGMVSIAAGMARANAQAWVYSIAPFCYARPFEQIRNDVCLNDLPVRLVGNGGGYAYGSMGATHHAIEDYGVLSTLPKIRIYIPAFDVDVDPIIRSIARRPEPAYLRLGRSEIDDEKTVPAYAPWRQLQHGNEGLIIAVGPLAGGLWRVTRELPHDRRPTIWAISELAPELLDSPPREFIDAIASAKTVLVAEEHVAVGGFGQQLLHGLALRGISLPNFIHQHARGYPSGRYGSQTWHRQESGLDPAAILNQLAEQLGSASR